MKTKILFILTIAFFISCSGDDDLQTIEIEGNEVSITPTLTIDDGSFGIENQDLNYTVTLPSAFSSDATVTVSIELSDPTNSFSDASVLIPAGETQGQGSITVNEISNLNPLAGIESIIKAKGFLLSESDGNNYVIGEGTETPFTVYETFPIDIDDDVTIALDWSDATLNNIDLELYDEFGDSTGSIAESGERVETLTFGSDLIDGTYFVRYNTILLSEDNLSVNVFSKTLSDNILLEQTQLPVLAGNPEGFPVDQILASITKVTDTDGLSTYEVVINI